MINIKYLNKNALINNLSFCQKHNKNIMAMVKANAYGHGVKYIANTLNDKVTFWGVANSDEALELRKLVNPLSTVLVVGKSTRFKTLIKNKIHITVDTLEELKKIGYICKKNNTTANIHIAVNSGMNRLGVKDIDTFKQMLKFVNTNGYITLKGVFTHCFDEDCAKNHFEEQMSIFKQFVNCISDKNVLIHVGGSFCLNQKLPDFVNMVRVGYFLYGYGNPVLQPVMSIVSKIIKITNCCADEYVGYGNTKLTKNTTVALVPLGYADGIPWLLSNMSYVYINNIPCKILGKICMDMLMVDITDKNIKINDNVIIFDNAEHLSNIAKSSPYEILTNFTNVRAKTIIK